MDKKVTFSRRMMAVLVDFGVMAIFISPFILLTIALEVFFDTKSMLFNAFIMAMTYAYLFCKDFIWGQSIGKKKYRLTILKTDDTPPSPLRMIARNLFLPLWLVESIILLIHPERRLGDWVCSTKVVYNHGADTKLRLEKKNLLTFTLIVVIVTLLYYVILRSMLTLVPTLSFLYS